MKTVLMRSFVALATIGLSQTTIAQCGGGNLVFRNFTCICSGGYTVTITKCDGSDAQNCQQANGVLQPCGNNCYALQDTSCGGGGITQDFQRLKVLSDPTILSAMDTKTRCGGNQRLLEWLEIKLQLKANKAKKFEVSKAAAIKEHASGDLQ